MKKFTLELDEKNLFIVGKAVGLLPYNEVNELIADIQKQIDAQSAPAEASEDNVVSMGE